MITEISNFQNEIEVSDELISSIRMSVKQTLMSVAEKTDYEVSIALVDDSEIAELNEKYRNKVGPTDVLSFPMDEEMEEFPLDVEPETELYVHHEDDDTEVEMATDVMFEFAEDGVETHEFNDGVSNNVPMLGDIIISMPRAKLQAEEYGHSLEREVCFLTVHGVLHLLGYDHMTDEETREMRNLEDKVLSELGISR